MAVIKCDAYGHGLIPVARTLAQAGVNHFIVAGIKEGIQLRESGFGRNIFCLSDPLYPEPGHALEHDLCITAGNMQTVSSLESFQVPGDKKLKVQIKVDTGLSRFGVAPEEVLQAFSRLSRNKGILIKGIYSHLASTFRDNPESNAYTRQQMDLFERVLDNVQEHFPLPELVHLGSSTGLLGFADQLCTSRLNSIRIGTLLFGFTEREHSWDRSPTPAARVQTRVLQTKSVKRSTHVGYHLESRLDSQGHVAVINGGFYHGLQAIPAGCPACVINNRQAFMLGTPAMAQTFIDITGIPDVNPGSRVILAGPELNACETARKMNRGTWSLLLPLLKNAAKVYPRE